MMQVSCSTDGKALIAVVLQALQEFTADIASVGQRIKRLCNIPASPLCLIAYVPFLGRLFRFRHHQRQFSPVASLNMTETVASGAPPSCVDLVIIGAGPAGLMAAVCL